MLPVPLPPRIPSLGQQPAPPPPTADLRGEAAAALVGLGVALFGSMGKKEPIMIIVGSVMAGIGGAGLVSGLVKYATK